MKLQNRIDFISTLEEIDYHFSEVYWQHDRIFVPQNYSRDQSLPRLSLRTIVHKADKNAIYALVMRRHNSEEGYDVVNSTQVKDYAEAAHILYQLGYELKYEVSRHREELNMGETIKVYIDKIDGLPGYYGRIESDLSDGDNVEEARNDLIETFRVLGVKGEPVNQTYGELLDSSAHDTIAG